MLSVDGNFSLNVKRKDGLQNQCKECHKQYRREHYLSNRKKYICKSMNYKKEARKWWEEFKKQFQCEYCGESHPACLHFHHVNDDKESCIAWLIGSASKEKVFKEIAKCIPLCANCHAKLHWEKSNGFESH
jgi:hypothetical protein